MVTELKVSDMAFDPTNRHHKKQLYPVLRALADINPKTTPELLIDEACGKPLARGKDYMNNVRKGDFAKSIAQLVHIWLRDNHFEIAHKTSPDIFDETPDMRWQKIVDERAIEGRLKIVPVKTEMGIARRARDVQSAKTTLKLGKEFCLELDSDEDGYVILLQCVRNKWHLIPLIDGKDNVLPISEGKSVLPQTSDVAPDPLVEIDDLGVHTFAIVASKQPTIPFATERLVGWVNGHVCQIHCTAVRFVE